MSRLFDLTSTPIEDGMTVVEASAGTGKTYCLTGLVLRLLLERRVSDVSQLLVVTFTNAATQELVDRLRAALSETCRLLGGESDSGGPFGDDPFFRHLADTYRGDSEALRIVREALARFDDLTVSTIHGFCLRVLDESAFESGEPFEGELVESAAPLLLEAARDVWRRLLYVPPGRLRRDVPPPRLDSDGAPGIVAMIVTEKGLTPESFLPDLELWLRHPRTEILPQAPGLETATARLGQAHHALRESWDLPAIRMLLESRRFLRGSYFAGGVLAQRLSDADAFCRATAPAGLRPVLELAADRLEPGLFKRDRARVAQHPVVTACSDFSTAVEAFHHALRCRFVTDVARRFEAEKRSTLTWTYDDLLRRLRDALDDPRRASALVQAVRRRYHAALIDEFQDTDLIQYRIFHRLFRRGPMILIGDPKQAIYRFRGADVFAYLAARDDADRVYTLEHNWRTEKPLVEAVNAVFNHANRGTGRPFVFEQIAFQPVAAARQDDSQTDPIDDHRPLQWIWIPRLRTRELANSAIEHAVVQEIARLLSGTRPADPTSPDASATPLAPDDLAVLVRTNGQAMSLQSALRTVGVPSVIGRSGDIFQTEEMADLEALLSAIAEPGDGGRLRAAWATRLWGMSDLDIRELNCDDEAFTHHVERFGAYRHDWRRRGFTPMIQQLFAERGVRQRLLSSVAGERRLTNLTHAIEVVHRAERERHLSPTALLGWLAGERSQDRQAADDTELRLESDAAAVQIATVHRSKGLEYEVVFCPFLWQGRETAHRPVQAHIGDSRLVLDYGSEAVERHRSQAEAERLSEDARLTYVALTRARRRCYVVWGDVPGKNGPAASALGYLLHRNVGAPAAGHRGTGEPGELARQALTAVKAARKGWLRELQNLITAHADVMELRSVEEMTARLPESRRRPSPSDLRPRRFHGAVPRGWSLQSFSSLSRVSHGPEPLYRAISGEEPDVADPAMPTALLPSAATPGDALAGEHDAASSEDEPKIAREAPPRAIAAFARGRRAGSCLHRVLERCDLAHLESVETEEVIAEALRRFGLEDPERHTSTPPIDFDPARVVRELLSRLATAPVPGVDVRLGAVPRAAWLVEWKFTMPLGRLTPRRLATIFRDHGQGVIGREYPARLETLDRREVHGYLTGFVDLLFEHAGRWVLIDWKSNDLGPNLEAYGAEGMWQAMAHHHYVLQYHLYLVALHRFLGPRTPDYDYQRHIAGAFYVFLRGLDDPVSEVSPPSDGSPRADDGEATGWYVDRPPLALIEALDALIGGRE